MYTSCMTETIQSIPRVSILIPVFNRREYIAECIQSALDQTFVDFEIVVVDNASDDGTWEICREFAAQECKVRVFRNDHNIGPVQNWKRCTEEARGMYSKILFSDDCLEPTCLSEMVPKLDDPTVALVYCAARIGKTRQHSVIAYVGSLMERLPPRQFLNQILTGGAAAISPGAVLIRTVDLLNNLHLQFPTRLNRSYECHGAGPDVMISLLTADLYKCVANIPKPLAFYRAHTGSITIKNNDNQVIESRWSVFSFYLKNKLEWRVWINYVAYIWIARMKAERKLVNPSTHIRNYEGIGSLNELAALFYFAAAHLINRLLGRKIQFVL
jgi:glycosyltransferase involved in cell wall biosynthesis